MKRLTFLCIIVLSFAACTNKLTSLQLNNEKSIEGVKLGMDLKSAVQRIDKDYFVEKSKAIVFESEKIAYEYIVYSDNTKKEIRFTFNGGYDNKSSDNVYRIVIKSPKYYTSEGICVGMSVHDLREKAQLKSADFNYDEGLFILSKKFEGGYWIDFDPEKYTEINLEQPEINTLPGELKIKAIVFY